MRGQLQRIDEQRGVFTGVFAKYGTKAGYKGAPSVPTILLVAVKDAEGKPVTDHLWLNCTKGFESLGELRAGMAIRFEARVKRYQKGYVNRRIGVDESRYDYKLSHPTKIVRVNG